MSDTTAAPTGNTPPDTIIVVHEKERAAKCSVQPLRGRAGLQFLKWPRDPVPQLPGYVRLSLDGPELSKQDSASGLLLLDGTWRYAAQMEADFISVPPRSLPPWVTAYPRVSKVFDDPPTQLATVEALYAAYTILGRSTAGLLDHYRWADAFLEANRSRVPDATSGFEVSGQ